MAAICRIYRRTGHGVKLVAQIRGKKVTGPEAAAIQKLLKQYGFPRAPIEDIVDQLLLADHELGAAVIPDKKDRG